MRETLYSAMIPPETKNQTDDNDFMHTEPHKI